MLPLLTLFAWMHCQAITFEEDWIEGTPLLPRQCQDVAIGTWDNTIFIIGGSSTKKQFVEYDIANNSIVDHGTYLSHLIHGFGQFYHQKHNYLYMIHGLGASLSLMDLSSDPQQLQQNWNDIIIPQNVDSFGCLAGNDQDLFIVGGDQDGPVLDTLQILRLSSLEWRQNPPSLNIGRRGAACIVHETSGFLYVFGGYPYFDAVPIEKIAIVNILTNTWQITTDLVYPADGARAISYDEDYILLIGGWRDSTQSNFHAANEYIQIIDTKNDNVSLSSSPFNVPSAASGVIVTGNIMYKFGGNTQDKTTTNKWEFYDISRHISLAPTKSSSAPSLYPSASTMNPSSAPIQSHVYSSTVYPTIAPSSTPIKLTSIPSKFPLFSEAPTEPPGQIVCGERRSGAYKNAPISFEVVMLFQGYLEFDASLSDPLTISQLSVVFTVTPVASDTDHDGIITLQNTVAGTYTFTIIAHNGVNQTYDVQTSCHRIDTTVSNRITSTVAIETTDTGLTGNGVKPRLNMFGISDNQFQVVIFILIALIVLCLSCGVSVFCLRYHHKKENKGKTEVDIACDMVMSNVIKVQPSIPSFSVVAPIGVNVTLVKSWLTETVALPQYVDRFIENGFDSFKTIKRIHNEQVLIEIGITKKGHVDMIMSEIRELQNPEGDQGRARKESYTAEGSMQMEMITRPRPPSQNNEYEDMYGSIETSKENKTMTGGNTT